MINLLHPEIKESRMLNQRFSKLLVFIVVVILLAISTWLSLLFAHQNLSKKNQELDDQISSVGSKVLKYLRS